MAHIVGAMSERATRLRELIEGPEITVLPGAYDAVSARLIEQTGFDAMFTSGYGLSGSALGYPDIGLMTFTENVDRVRHVNRAVDIPVIADMDTGYGGVLNVRRTVEECMDAGVAGVMLEDQEWPKRCGHMEDKRVVDREVYARRLAAAADVRAERDGDLVIVARTDARGPLGLDEALDRGRMARELGADVIFVETPETREELETVAATFEAPTFADMLEGGKTPFIPYPELEEIGYDLVVYGLSPLFAATRAVRDVLETLRDTGTTDGVETSSFDDFYEVIGTGEYNETAAQYLDVETDVER